MGQAKKHEKWQKFAVLDTGLHGFFSPAKTQSLHKIKKQKIGHREGFRQIQVFCFRFDNCNNTILVYAYILIYCRLAVVSGCVKVVVLKLLC